MPDGFTEVRQALTAGVPHRVELGAGVHAVLILPTGLARQWLDTDPSRWSAAPPTTWRPPAPPATPRPPALVGRCRCAWSSARAPDPRLAAARRRPAPGLPRRRPDHRAHPTVVELLVLSWLLHAGTVRGSGDYGSSLALAWRRADRAVDQFGPPPINEFVWRRRPPAQRVESELGPGRLRYRYLLDKKLRRVLR
ncbi:hypothetical protein NKG94_11075 [Micromonospora sp. M12]